LADGTDRWLAAGGVSERETGSLTRTGSLTFVACEQLSSLFLLLTVCWWRKGKESAKI